MQIKLEGAKARSRRKWKLLDDSFDTGSDQGNVHIDQSFASLSLRVKIRFKRRSSMQIKLEGSKARSWRKWKLLDDSFDTGSDLGNVQN